MCLHKCGYLWKPGGYNKSPEAGAIGEYEPPYVVAGTQTLVVCKINKCS